MALYDGVYRASKFPQSTGRPRLQACGLANPCERIALPPATSRHSIGRTG
jgi:hypothetical protein